MRKILLLAAMLLGAATTACAQRSSTDSTATFCKEKVAQLFKRDSIRQAAIERVVRQIQFKHVEISEEQMELKLNRFNMFINVLINRDDPSNPFPMFVLKRGLPQGGLLLAGF